MTGTSRLARVLGAVALLWTGACSPPRVPVVTPDPWPPRVTAADARAAEGCYRCLAAALSEYETALAAWPDAALGVRAFRTAVDLAVRERLLGLYPGVHQDAPARLAAVASPTDRAVVEEVLPAVPWRRGTLPPELGHLPPAATLASLRARRRSLEAQADHDPWQSRLLLALVAGNPIIAVDEIEPPRRGAPPALDPDRWSGRHVGDAAFTFTRLLLLRSSITDVASFHAVHPAFDEIDVLVGEAELGRGRLVSAEEALARALAAMPGLVPARVLSGDVRQRMEDFALALSAYDTLLVRVPDHREALLGRVKSLGYLGRHEAAVATADRMLALGTWYLGEAQYWKAWNLYSLTRLDEARAAVDAARSVLVNADLSYLGGVIAFKQRRHDDAQKDFDAAVDLESRHCEAHFDRAALQLTMRAWPAASTGFDEAFECLQARTAVIEQRIVDAREARLAVDARQSLVTRREQALRDHREQLAWARYNGSVAYANIGQPVLARTRAAEAITIGGPAAAAAQRLLPQLPP